MPMAPAIMADTGKRKPAGKRRRDRAAGAPERRCLATREARPKAEMIRFAVGPDGALVPDLAEVLPGRGLWLTARRDALDTALEKRLFGRAARRAVTVADDLAERIEVLLAERCVGLLGLANRAGQLAAGERQVREWLKAGKAAILLAAADSEGRDAAELKRRGRDLRFVDALTSVELARAIGRERIVHMAVAPGRLAEALTREAGRLAGMRAAAAGTDGPALDETALDETALDGSTPDETTPDGKTPNGKTQDT